MKNVWLLACLLLGTGAVGAQPVTGTEVPGIFKVETYPTYGNDADWRAYQAQNRNLEAAYRDVDAAGRAQEQKVWVRVSATKSGRIRKVTLVNSVPASLGAEAIRLVRESGTWRPGMLNGRPQKSSVTLAITFPPYTTN